MPAVAGIESLAPTTDNNLKVLSAISGRDESPVIVTFYAKDGQDFLRLSSSLATFAGTNALQKYKNAQNAIATSPDGSKDANERRQQAGNSATPTTLADQTGQSANGQSQVSNSGLKFGSGALNANNDTVTVNGGNLAVAGTVGVTSGGVVVFNPPPALDANSIALRNDTNRLNGFSNNGGQLYNDENVVPQNSGNYSLNNGGNSNLQSVRNSSLVLQNVQAAAARGGPYRLALSPGQLEDLARNYRLALIARGDMVYQFQTIGDRAPVTADARQRAELLSRASFANASAVASAPVTASPAPSTMASKSAATYDGSITSVQSGTTAPASSQPALIDCVITMESPPGP